MKHLIDLVSEHGPLGILLGAIVYLVLKGKLRIHIDAGRIKKMKPKEKDS